MDYITEALKLLEEDDLDIEVIDSKNVPSKVEPKTTSLVDNELNARLLSKIEELSKALANALEKEHLGTDLDPELIKQDMIRDCGLMGGIISTDELDTEHNPFDAATKQMHDMGPVDTQMACNTLLNVPVDEFVNRIIMGLKHERGLLPGPRTPHQLPHRDTRRIR